MRVYLPANMAIRKQSVQSGRQNLPLEASQEGGSHGEFSWQLKNGYSAAYTLGCGVACPRGGGYLKAPGLGSALDDKQAMHAMSIDDMYHVERVLANGQGGVTELVTVEGTGPFVRKKIPNELANRGVWSALASCECRRLPRVEATYALPEQFVVVYDFVPGQTLEAYVAERGPASEAEACSLISDICEAAGALHAQGVIHRDISPRNVIVSADGAHLVDLGIARLRVEGASRDTTSLGTWGYASPEQYGFAQTDARSDVYSIGRIMGFVLTGMAPDAEGYQDALEATVSAGARAVVLRACAFEPSGRYQSAAEFAAALAALGEKGEADGASEPAGAAAAAAASPATAQTAAGDASSNGPAPSASGVASARVAAGDPAAEPARSKGISRRAAIAGAGVVALAGAGALAARALGAFGGSDNATTAAATAESATASTEAASASESTVETTVVVEGAEPLELAETAWLLTDSGMVSYVAGIKNPNADVAYTMVGVTATGYDAEGNVLFNDDQGIMVALPGRTSYYAGHASPGDALALSRVDISLSQGSTTSAYRQTGELALDVSNLREGEDSVGFATFTGKVSVSSTGEALDQIPSYCSSIAVTVLLRDALGKLVWATTDYVDNLAEGTQAFEVMASEVPDHAACEACAQPW